MHRQAGDADDVHPCIGCARRFMVPHRDLQHDVLVEAVQNHCPDVLVVDEIGTRKVSLCTPKILVHFCVTRNKATTLGSFSPHSMHARVAPLGFMLNCLDDAPQ